MPTINFSCESGQHKEANECPNHPCWCWLRTHTYEFSDILHVESIIGELKAGPREFTGTTPIDVFVSVDGTNFEKIYTVSNVSYKSKTSFRIDNINRDIKYLQFKSERRYVDYSSGTITYSDDTQPSPPPAEGGIPILPILSLIVLLSAGYYIYRRLKT